MLELVVGKKIPREPHQGFLVSAARLRIDLLDAGGLLLQRREGGLELVEGIALLLAARKACQPEQIIVVDQENVPCVGERGLEGELRKPLGRSSRCAFTGDFLLRVNRQQRVARQRVQRLHPTIRDHRQRPEALEIEALRRTRRPEHVRGDVNEADRRQQPGEMFGEKVGHTTCGFRGSECRQDAYEVSGRGGV